MAEEKVEKKEVKEAPKAKPVEKKVEAHKPEKVKAADLPNEHSFLKGEELEVKGLKFLVKEVKGVDVVLARKDFK